jgi:hypothetical protein
MFRRGAEAQRRAYLPWIVSGCDRRRQGDSESARGGSRAAPGWRIAHFLEVRSVAGIV